MAFSSRSPDRTDALARLQSDQPPWLPASDAVVVGPDRELGESPGDPHDHDPHRRTTDPSGPIPPGPPDDVFRTPATPLWLNTATAGTVSSHAQTAHEEPALQEIPQHETSRLGHSRVHRGRWLDDVDDLRRFDEVDRRRLADPDDDESVARGRARRSRGLLVAPPAAIALVVVGVIACLVTAYTLASGSDDSAPTVVAFPSTAGAASRAVPASVAGGASGSGSPSAAPTTSSSEVVVSVVGLVRTPGLVHLAATARVADAIATAGGGRPGADLLSLNMAQPVRDGDQILVGFADPAGGPATMRSAVVSAGATPGAAPGGASPTGTGGGSPPSGAGSSEAVVDLNTADAAALDSLPGVGPVTAAAIIEWRTRNGGFTSIDQLAEVDGIGPGRLAKLRDRVRV